MHAREYRLLRQVEDQHWWYAILHGQVLDALAQRVPEKPWVLDAGCGTGGMIQRLHNAQPEWRLEGVDADAAAAAYCLGRGLRNVTVTVGDVAALPYPDVSFDAVLSLDVLYHAGVDEERALQEMVRVLRPGGLLVLNLPAFECLRGSHDVAVCGARRYKACQVRSLLMRHSLEAEMMHYWNAWLFPPLLLRRRWTRLLAAHEGGASRSDVALPPCWLNRLLTALGKVDASLCRRWRLPWGSSLFAVARKPSTQ